MGEVARERKKEVSYAHPCLGERTPRHWTAGNVFFYSYPVGGKVLAWPLKGDARWSGAVVHRLLNIPEVIHSPPGLVSLYWVTVCDWEQRALPSALLGRYLLGPSGTAEGTEGLRDISTDAESGCSMLTFSLYSKEIFWLLLGFVAAKEMFWLFFFFGYENVNYILLSSQGKHLKTMIFSELDTAMEECPCFPYPFLCWQTPRLFLWLNCCD